MFDHEFSNRNYVLITQLKSLSDVDPNVLDKFKTHLDIDTTSKTIRINIYDVFTLYALLDKKPTEEDIKSLLNLHKPFVKNYIDETKLQMEDEYMLYDFLDSLGDTKIEGGIKQQSISNRLINSLKQLRDDIKKYDTNLDNKVYGGGIDNELNKYKSKTEAIKSNKSVIDDLNDEFLKSELNELLEEIETDYDNINKKIEHYKTQNEIPIVNIKPVGNDNLVEDKPIEQVEIQNSDEDPSFTYIIFGVLLLIILMSCIICYYVVKFNYKQTTIDINNKPKFKKEEVNPFNLTNEISLKVNDVDVKLVDKTKKTTNKRSNSQSNPRSNSKKKYVTTELDILKSELDRDINKILNIEDPNKLANIEPITIQNVPEPVVEETVDSDQNTISNDLLHKLEENRMNNTQEDMFGNLELI